MKKRVIGTFLLIVLVGCQSSLKTPPTPANFNQYSAGATDIALTTAPTTTFTPAAVITATQKSYSDPTLIFRDDFDVNLANEWLWINPDPSHWSTTAVKGMLQIDSLNGYFNLNNAHNLLYLPAPQGDFILETSLLFNPVESQQFAGIIAYESSENFVQAGIGYCSTSVGCIGQGFYIDIYKDGKLTLPRNMTSLDNNNVVFVRLAIQAGKLIVFSSYDGIAWYRVLEKPLDFTAAYVGLISAQNNYPSLVSAQFDYFEIRSLVP